MISSAAFPLVLFIERCNIPVMANPPLDEYHKVENWSNLKLI